jgi:DNA repair exonuclease SbcCD nuclease subunit
MKPKSTRINKRAKQAIDESLPLEIIHAGDFHVGSCRSAFNYLERHRLMFQGIIDLVIERKKHANVVVALAGDMLDRKTITEEERNLLLWFIIQLVHLKVHIVVINGNHDYYNEDGITMIHPLHLMQSLCPKLLHVVVDNADVVNIPELDVSFLCVPCQQDLTTKKLRKTLSKLDQRSTCSRRYGLVHEAINGSIANDNHKMKNNCDIPDHELDGILCGDIHRMQQIGKKAWYCGSPLQVKSDEDLEKGVLLWKAGVDDPKQIVLKNVPKIIKVTSVKELRKLEGTQHTVKYVGEKRVESDAVNVSIQPNLKVLEKKRKIVDCVEEITNDVSADLGAWLKSSGLSDDEIEEAVGMVDAELTK